MIHKSFSPKIFRAILIIQAKGLMYSTGSIIILNFTNTSIENVIVKLVRFRLLLFFSKNDLSLHISSSNIVDGFEEATEMLGWFNCIMAQLLKNACI